MIPTCLLNVIASDFNGDIVIAVYLIVFC